MEDFTNNKKHKTFPMLRLSNFHSSWNEKEWFISLNCKYNFTVSKYNKK